MVFNSAFKSLVLILVAVPPTPFTHFPVPDLDPPLIKFAP